MVCNTPWVRPDEGEATAESDIQSPVARRLLASRDCFVGKPLSQLAREQGVGPIKDIGVFAGGFPDDEDIDEMLEEIYRLREP
jgi:hypothetical protein